ncbi:hypothetical protein [Gimesia algae]|uniref:Uncharacterized protein n=1 Tax=Gimesia algae TaxID=2527971 RepID=A0A517VMZ7_9PLAN|nr:hypothetical protein [Gimesia algae]QDT94355.1 hypothetical protein Pan161_60510 [Gimesia algae]
MILSYGDDDRPDNEANCIISRAGLEAEDGFIYGYTEKWDITGFLQADSDSELVEAFAALLAAYSIQGQDLVWKKGSMVMHQLISANTLTGTRVTVLPHFPNTGNGELTTFRSYAISVEADVSFQEINLDAPQVLKYEESFNTTGSGGPRFGLLPTITGYYQRQQLTETSPITIVQSGMKVGLGAYPTPNVPLYPDYEHVDRRQINQGTVRRKNGVGLEYPIHWNYTFERNQAFPTA